MDARLHDLKLQFKGIAEDLEKRAKDASPEAALLALIASLLFVLIDTVEAKKS